MDHVIIGIHGLAPKPPKDTLSDWWETSIMEGLDLNHSADPDLSFELAYWAHVRKQTKPVGELDERYEKANPPLNRFDAKKTDKIKTKAKEKAVEAASSVADLPVVEDVVEKATEDKFADLKAYYADEATRKAIRQTLIDAIQLHRGKRILILAHSMGSIIAHDVLRLLESDSEVEIEHLVTIGSPLAFPDVKTAAEHEFGNPLIVPKNVRTWTNVADPDDEIAADNDLTNDFEPTNGVQVEDVLVNNEYVNHKGEANQHKSFGYLRAPEMSDAILAFLKAG